MCRPHINVKVRLFRQSRLAYTVCVPRFVFFGCIHLHGQSFISCFRDLSIQLCSQTVFPSTSILAPAPSPVYVSLIYWKVILFILNSVMQTNSTEKKTASRSDTVDFWRDVIYHSYYIFFSVVLFTCTYALMQF